MHTRRNSLKKEWRQFAEIEEDDTDLSIDRTRKMVELEQQLNELGYHFQISTEGEVLYSSLTAEETEKIREYFEDSYNDIRSLTLSDEDGSIIKNTFPINGEECEIVAVSMADSKIAGHTDSYLQKYIISFIITFLVFVLLAIAGTNFILSHLITRMIMKPLGILKKGTKEIADGNLDFQLEYANKDEFGEVCREFDAMRGHLKESVETQLSYEKYRRELIVGISHDLRTPLTSIKGYVEGLKDGIANTEEKRERYYNAIHTRAMDMEALSEMILLSTITDV